MGIFSKRAAVPGNPIESPRGGGRVHARTDGRDVLLNSPDGWETDAPWLWWTGPAGGDGTGGPFGMPLSMQDPTGITSMAAVQLCTSRIVDTIAGLPWYVRRGEWERLPTPDWIADPQMLRVDQRIVDPATLWDARLSSVEFWAQWICAALWFGDGYIYVPVRDETGQPKPPLWQFHPFEVRIDGGTYWIGEVPLPSHSVIHLRGQVPYWDGHGRGVITTCGAELGLAATVRVLRKWSVHHRRAGRLPQVEPTEHESRASARSQGRVARAARRRQAEHCGFKCHD